MTRLPLLTGLCLLTACGAPPLAPRDPEPPPLPPLEGVADPTSLSAPLTLARAVELALQRNPDARAALARIGAAESGLREAESAFYPQLSGRLSYLGTNQPAQAFGLIVAQRRFSPTQDVNDPGFTEGFRPELVLALPVFRGGADWYRREATRLGLEARRYEREAIQNGLRAAVHASFFLFHAARREVAVADHSVGAVREALRQARTRVKTGTSLRSDVLSLEVRLAESEEQRLRARNAIARIRAALRSLLALPAGTAFELAAPPPADRELPGALPEAIALAQRHRPELAAVERVVDARQQQIDQAWAGYLPRIDLFAAYGHDARGLKLTSDRDNFTVGVAVELDLFSGFRTTARVAGARRRLAESRAHASRARLSVEREVTEAFLALGEARARASVSAKGLTAAREAFRLVAKQYATGGALITRLLETELARARAESRSIAAQLDVRRGRAELRRALGVWR